MPSVCDNWLEKKIVRGFLKAIILVSSKTEYNIT